MAEIEGTDSRILLEKLRISEEQFRGAFEDAAIGMAIVGVDGTWIHVNYSLSVMLGYSPSELRTFTFQELTHPEDLNNDLYALNKLILDEEDTYKMEKRYFHKGGSIVHALLSVSVVRDQERKPLHFVSQITDITEIKKNEDRLNVVLGLIGDQNKKLLNFAHIVSHNLRSHSGNLNTLLNFLKVEYDEAARKELLEMINNAASSLDHTIFNLTEVIPANNNLQPGLKPVNLKSVVNDAMVNVQALLRQIEGRCMNRLSDLIHVNVIPAYLESIILNLLTNAIKYRSLERKLVVQIKAEVTPDYIVLSVKDNGSGIDLKQNGNKIFGIYETFHTNCDSKGIGLFITKNQVEAMGGKITIESEPGLGSLFRIYLKGQNK